MSKCIDCGGPVNKGDNCCEVCFNKPKAIPRIEKPGPSCSKCGAEGPIWNTKYHLCKACWDSVFATTHFKVRHCRWCGGEFKGIATALYCQGSCRVAAHRAGKQDSRPRSKNGQPQHPPLLKLRFQVLERDKFTCTYCGRSVNDGVELQIDHIHPESKGGKWVESNLTTACRECNIGKGDQILTFRKPSLQSVS